MENSAIQKPSILILADRPNWAFDISAQEIKVHLAHHFAIDIQYVCQNPQLEAKQYDLIHVMAWVEQYHKSFGFPPEKVLREVASQRWVDFNPPLSLAIVAQTYLEDCGTLVTPSLAILKLLRSRFPNAMHGPNGFNHFIEQTPLVQLSGKMRVGWVGSRAEMNKSLKGLDDILIPASRNLFDLEIASNVPVDKMPEFYNNIDVIAVASRHEGGPLPLIEGMAMGCFPVTTRVGVAPELIKNGSEGKIVEKRTVKCFREAFQWCEEHLDFIRETRASRAAYIRKIRNWSVCAEHWKTVYETALVYAKSHPSPPDFTYPSIPTYPPVPTRECRDNRWNRKLERFLRPYIHAILGKKKKD